MLSAAKGSVYVLVWLPSYKINLVVGLVSVIQKNTTVHIYITELEITVGHCIISDHFC